MNGYYALKVLANQGFYRPDTFVLGDVEIRSPRDDLSDEKEAIKTSAERQQSPINYCVNCRIGTIVDANSLADVYLLADEKFVKAIDIVSADLPISDVRLSGCGYVKDLTTGKIHPMFQVSFPPAMSFIIGKGVVREIEFSQWVAVQDFDLANRYKRSLHWGRNAKWESNLQLKILFEWFAVEALFKENRDDNVGPLLRWFLGYPNGSSAASVSRDLINQLQTDDAYSQWKGIIIDSIESIRDYRNKTVHNGFRSVDFCNEKSQLYNQIMVFGCSRSQKAVRTGLQLGIKTIQEFKEYVALVFEANANLVNDVHGTILYSLKNRQYGYNGAIEYVKA